MGSFFLVPACVAFYGQDYLICNIPIDHETSKRSSFINMYELSLHDFVLLSVYNYSTLNIK